MIGLPIDWYRTARPSSIRLSRRFDNIRSPIRGSIGGDRCTELGDCVPSLLCQAARSVGWFWVSLASASMAR